MPSKKKKYNARFPAGRIKKIMQSDEEVGKVAQAVPIIISRTLELFVESLLNKTLRITNARNAKTLSPSHMKQCIMSESRFDFLRELVKNVPDINVAEEQSIWESGGGGGGGDCSTTATATPSQSPPETPSATPTTSTTSGPSFISVQSSSSNNSSSSSSNSGSSPPAAIVEDLSNVASTSGGVGGVATATGTTASVTTSSQQQKPISPNSSNNSSNNNNNNSNTTASISTVIRNGNKRNISGNLLTSVTTTAAASIGTSSTINTTSQHHSLLDKQKSLDLSITTKVAEVAPSLASPHHQQETTMLNYYTEINRSDCEVKPNSSPSSSSSVIQHTSSSNQRQSQRNPDIRPPKLTRIDSAPASLTISSNDSTTIKSQIKNQLYSPQIKKITNNDHQQNSSQMSPVINFDFSQSVISTSSSDGTTSIIQPILKPIIYSESQSTTIKSQKGPIPQLTRIHTTQTTTNITTNAATSSTSSSSSSKSNKQSTNIPTNTTTTTTNTKQSPIITPPSFVKIDVSKSPLVKIDYSQLKLDNTTITSDQQQLTIKKTNLNNSIKNTTTNTSLRPIINIDLSKNFQITPPNFNSASDINSLPQTASTSGGPQTPLTPATPSTAAAIAAAMPGTSSSSNINNSSGNNSNASATTTATSTNSIPTFFHITNNSSSLLEMDEDYDNL